MTIELKGFEGVDQKVLAEAGRIAEVCYAGWETLENAITNLLEEFPDHRDVIALLLRKEADEVESKDPGSKYADAGK
jgi:hypothetical protein